MNEEATTVGSERECSDEMEWKNGKANPFGWSTAELWHNGEQIGEHYCGKVTITHPDYRMTETKEPPNITRVRVYCLCVDEALQ